MRAHRIGICTVNFNVEKRKPDLEAAKLFSLKLWESPSYTHLWGFPKVSEKKVLLLPSQVFIF